jgi:hypothetical protein
MADITGHIGRRYRLLLFRRRSQVVRQGSAKPRSRVQIPSSPQTYQHPGSGVFCFGTRVQTQSLLRNALRAALPSLRSALPSSPQTYQHPSSWGVLLWITGSNSKLAAQCFEGCATLRTPVVASRVTNTPVVRGVLLWTTGSNSKLAAQCFEGCAPLRTPVVASRVTNTPVVRGVLLWITGSNSKLAAQCFEGCAPLRTPVVASNLPTPQLMGCFALDHGFKLKACCAML